MSENSHKARRKLFESQGFRREVAERLNLDLKMVQPAINVLVAAGVVPCTHPDNAEALAMDGAWLLMGIGSRVRPDAIPRVTPRFASMALQIDSDRFQPAPKDSASSHIVTFEAELAAIFRNAWDAESEVAMPPVQGVGLFWADGRGSVLFGTIDAGSEVHPGTGRSSHRRPSSFLKLQEVNGITSISSIPSAYRLSAASLSRPFLCWASSNFWPKASRRRWRPCHESAAEKRIRRGQTLADRKDQSFNTRSRE